MVNGSFVFGMDDDGPDVFDRTVEWAVAQGIETATFHILTPYPGHRRCTSGMAAAGPASLHRDWDLYDTRHVVFRPARHDRPSSSRPATGAPTATSTGGLDRARRAGQDTVRAAARHLAYAGGWKKFEPLWDLVIRARRVGAMLPVLERAR